MSRKALHENFSHNKRSFNVVMRVDEYVKG